MVPYTPYAPALMCIHTVNQYAAAPPLKQPHSVTMSDPLTLSLWQPELITAPLRSRVKVAPAHTLKYVQPNKSRDPAVTEAKSPG